MKNIFKSFVIISTIFFSITGNIEAQKITCYTINPPQKAVSIKKVGIMGFTSDYDSRDAKDVLADYMISYLLNEKRGIYNTQKGLFGLGKSIEGKTYIEGFNTNIYTVVEREQMEKILKEQSLSMSGVIDEKTAASVGAILGLDAIIVGSVSYESKTSSQSKEQLLGESMDCKKITVTTTASMKLIDVATAEIIGMENASFYQSDEKCDELRENLASTTTLLYSTLNSIAFKFVNYFSPSYGKLEITLEKIKIKELKKKFEEGVSFLEKGEIDRVYPYFYAIYEADSYNPSTAYNLGTLYEIVGNYEEALRYYEEAYEMNTNSDTYFKARKRAEAGVGTIQFLESIGKNFAPHEFNSNASANILSDKITVKGKDIDRIEIRDLPANNAEVVAKVPGGLQFQVIEKKGDWYRIKLKNNKEGYIHKSNVN